MGRVARLSIVGTDHQTFFSSATSTSSTGPSVPYKMDSLVHSWVSNSSIPSSRIPVVTAIEDHGLHADMPNRRSYTLLDIPVPPEAHKRPTQMQFTNCLPSPCPYSDSNSRGPPEPRSHGTAPDHSQEVHIIKASTCDVRVVYKQRPLGCELTRDNNICHMLESHDDKMLKHHGSPTSYGSSSFRACSDPITHAVGNQVDEYASCPPIRCLCMGPEGRVCLQYINCGVISAHFKDVHGIKDLTRRCLLDCTWRDCGRQVMRHNYVRHIRERHLKHGRKSVHKKPIRCTIGNSKPGRCTGAT